MRRCDDFTNSSMSENPATPPTHKTVTCPECGETFQRAIVWFGGREIMADRGCLCDACEGKRAQAVAAVDAENRFLSLWRNRLPEDYLRADPAKVAECLRPALEWAPAEGCRRLGLAGAAGAGKSMAVALVLKSLRVPFRWTNGFAARGLYNAAVTTDDQEKRKAAVKAWERICDAEMLVLDDVDKGNFTDAWCGALFDLLESRNGRKLPTIWTANLLPGQLCAKFAKSGDREQADAIERRLCQGAMILTAN